MGWHFDPYIALDAEDTERRLQHVSVHGSNDQIDWHDHRLFNEPRIVVGGKGNPGLVRQDSTIFFPHNIKFYVVSENSGLGVPFLFHL